MNLSKNVSGVMSRTYRSSTGKKKRRDASRYGTNLSFVKQACNQHSAII